MKTKLKECKEFLQEQNEFQECFREFKDEEKKYLKKEKKKEIKMFARANYFVQSYKSK